MDCMGRKWVFVAIIMLFVMSAVAFSYDVNSENITREKIRTTEILSEEIDIGIELEKEIKEGKSFTSSITIPITNIPSIDEKMKTWAIEQEDLFFSDIKSIEPPLSKHAKANFIIEPIVKRVKNDYLTYEMHIQYVIEDKVNDLTMHVTNMNSFVFNDKEKHFVALQDVINIPEIKNKNEFTRFLEIIPDGKQKEALKTLNIKTVEPIQWLLTDKNIEFLIQNDEKVDTTEVDRVLIEYTKLDKYLTDSYKKEFVPKPKKKKPKKPKKSEKKNKQEKKLVALTFDDGPDDKVTPKILKTLQKYDVKATFFMLTRSAEKYPDIAKQVAKQGHEIANHSETHTNLNKSKKSHIDKEVAQSKTQLQKITGVEPKLFRPPYGEYNSTVIEIAKKSDQKIVMWSVDTLDWQHKNKNRTIDIVTRDTKPLSIILMHDIHTTTADALPSLIEKLQKEGYEFVTTSEILKHLEPASNGVYYGR